MTAAAAGSSAAMLTTQLDGDLLKPQFLEQLRFLRERCGSAAERERCDRLATSLLLTARLNPRPPPRQQQRRPQTAMAAPGCGSGWDPYETTMNREYTQKACTPVNGECPKSAKGYRNPYQLGDPIGCTLYSDEFCSKPYSKPDPIRAATSSGARNHNPHPSKAFTTWRLPREHIHIAVDSRSPWSKPPSLEEAEKVLKAQYRSIYKRDYLGIPQGFQVKHAFSAPPDWKKEIPHTLNTEFRYHYQIQPHVPKLESDFKYGCYSNLHCAAQGVVPTVTMAHIKNQENMTQLTTYQRHFGKDYVDLPMVLNSLDPEEVEEYLQGVPKEEKKVLQRFLRRTGVREEKNATSFASKSKQCDFRRISRAPACPFY